MFVTSIGTLRSRKRRCRKDIFFEGVQGAVRSKEGDGGLSLLDGCGHERWPLELGVVEVEHDLAKRIAAVAEVGKEAVHCG